MLSVYEDRECIGSWFYIIWVVFWCWELNLSSTVRAIRRNEFLVCSYRVFSNRSMTTITRNISIGLFWYSGFIRIGVYSASYLWTVFSNIYYYNNKTHICIATIVIHVI